MSANADISVGANAQELERIREIIFGAQRRNFEQQLDGLVRDLKRLQENIDELSERLEQESQGQSQKIQDLRRESRRGDDDLKTELRAATNALSNEKVDRQTLGDLLIQLGNQLKGSDSVASMLSALVESQDGAGQ